MKTFSGTITIMIIVILVALGLSLGSFVNAFVWRLHEQAELRGKKGKDVRKKLRRLSIAKGRSMCPSCGHELAAEDLVPVLSWVWLRGKCRYCGAKIPDSPLVELVVPALFVISYLFWPFDFQGGGLFQFILWLWFVVMFVALAVYDLRWLLLPDRIVYPLVLLAGIQVLVVAMWNNDFAYIWQAALGAGLISGAFYLLFQVSQGSWIGGGDVKLALVLGLLAGSPLHALFVIFFASVYGTIVSVPLLVKSKSNWQAKVPFGPFLLLATFTVVIWGSHIVDWYTKTLL